MRDFILNGKAAGIEGVSTHSKLSKNTSRTLRSSSAVRLGIPLEKGTFQDSAAQLFNNLPEHIRVCSDFSNFCSDVQSLLLARYD